MRQFQVLLQACRNSVPTITVVGTLLIAAATVPVQAAPSELAGSEAAGGFTEAARDPVDPWEKFNRGTYKFNDTLDRYLLKPVAKGYRKIMPRPLDQAITNFFENLSTPLTLVNDLLQFKLRHFAVDSGRFLLNSTVGVLGFMDLATPMGLVHHPEDFGQTLAVWGVKPGPYVVLPFIGGRTLRDAFTMLPDSYLSYYRHIDDETLRYSLWGTDIVDTRADLIPAEQLVSGDRYVFLRDAYLQRRDYLIHDGQVKVEHFGEEDFGDFDEDQ